MDEWFPAEPVLLVEGEKDADRLRSLGYVAAAPERHTPHRAIKPDNLLFSGDGRVGSVSGLRRKRSARPST